MISALKFYAWTLRGVKQSITLAKKLNADMLILDGKIPREIATALGLRVVGSLALIHNCIEKRDSEPNTHRDYKEDEVKTDMD
ncbi:hypothetical protein C5S31_10845 [ANME-1 cluster archaeon GoMg2]|nr:hypothetical protein [ANME-1 cluster archaeon GoMg2]